jgi:phospholipid/cholesterol/gamma-HCH transport system substrate-binding protein
VDGLRPSTPIYINGLEVGLVSDVHQSKEDLHRIVVEFQIEKNVRIPKTAVAEIVSTNLMGNMGVNLVFEGNCQGDDCAKNGDYIKGVAKGMLASFATPDEVKVYMDVLNSGLKDIMDTLTYRLSQSSEINHSVKDVRAILTNLRSTTGRIDQLMARSSGSMENTLKNLEAVTGTLKQSNQQIKSIIANADDLTKNLKNTDMSGLTNEAKAAMHKLQITLASTDKAIADLEGILSNVKNGEGAVGMLLNDPEFAKSLDLTVTHLQLLLQDVRLHPERYRRILSKKAKPEYKKPERDPGLE